MRVFDGQLSFFDINRNEDDIIFPLVTTQPILEDREPIKFENSLIHFTSEMKAIGDLSLLDVGMESAES